MEIFDSFIEAGREMSKAERGRYYAALIDFLAYGEEPQGLTGASAAVFTAIRPVLGNSRTRAAAGAKGGRARAAKSKANVQAKREANDVANDVANQLANDVANGQPNSNSNSKEHITKGVICSLPAPNADGQAFRIVAMADPAFVAPTADEVREYALASGFRPFDYSAFVDYYASQGWRKSNGMPVSDWRSLCRSWASRQAEFDQRDGRAKAAEREETARMLDAEHGIDWGGGSL